MKVRVKLFAAARQLLDAEWVDIELERPATVGQLRQALIRQAPALERLVARAMIAVDAQYAADDAPLSDACEVALIPPVSGG